jgi:II/X family phage/plasmid replication protein
VSEELAALIEGRLITRSAVDGPTGHILYELVSGPLDGSYDHRVSVSVRRRRAVSVRLPARRDLRTGRLVEPVSTVYEDCAPFLEVEGSVHKALIGHNVYGGPCDVQAACTWFVGLVGELLGCELPSAAEWVIRRLDWAEVFELSLAGCAAYVRALSGGVYPRRVVHRYGDESVMWPGQGSSLKVYHKGPEFAKHDRARCRSVFGERETLELAWQAGRKLRVEVELKAKVLDEHFNGDPRVACVTRAWVEHMYDRLVGRVLRDGRSGMEVVRTAETVLARLVGVYGARRARAVYGSWLALSAVGEDRVRELLTVRTFYRHRKMLVEAGCSWLGSDVVLSAVNDGVIPEGFAPVLGDSRRLVEVHPRVVELLASAAA